MFSFETHSLPSSGAPPSENLVSDPVKLVSLLEATETNLIAMFRVRNWFLPVLLVVSLHLYIHIVYFFLLSHLFIIL